MSRPIWTTQSGPLVTGMITVKWVEQPLRISELSGSHSSTTPHSLCAISTRYNNKSLGPFFEDLIVDAAAARPRRGLHWGSTAAHHRARWCSSQLPPTSRRLVSQPRRGDMLLPWKYTNANRPATHVAHSWTSPAMDDGLSSATHHAQRRARAELEKRSSCKSEAATCTGLLGEQPWSYSLPPRAELIGILPT